MFLVVFKDWDSNASENFSFDDCVASCKSANTHLFGLDAFTVHMYIASKLSSSESLACTLCGGFVNASTAFTSSIVFTFVLCGFVRHLLVKFLTFLALELGCRTVESWSVSCVSTALTYVWIKGSLRFWFLLFLSLSMWLPLLRVWLKWLLLLDGFANADVSPYASLSSFALCLLGCLVFGLG